MQEGQKAMPFSHVVMVGMGYIGLPTAAVLARAGIQVTGVDINASVCETINAGKIHIVEPGLGELVKDQVSAGRLRATTSPVEADVFMIAVPTPFTDQMSADLRFVESAAKSISTVLRKGNLVILESTSPVGTTEMLLSLFSRIREDLFVDGEPQFSLAYCPERVLPGNVLHELVHNDRLVGGVNPGSTEKAKAFYQQVVTAECIATNAKTAEMAKLVENSFRDVNIAFANELSMLCDHVGVDVRELIRLANRHPRVNILQPGCGVGGHCIAVDPWFLVDSAPHITRLIKTARLVNDSKPSWVMQKLDQVVNEYLRAHPHKALADLHIAVYGLSFKPDIDDLRESPALDIATGVAQRYRFAKLSVVEPHIETLPKALRESGAHHVSIQDAELADIKLFLVAHTLFKAQDYVAGPYVLNVAW